MAATGIRLPPPPAPRRRPGPARLRLVWLHLVSRRVPLAVTLLAASGLVLGIALHGHWIQGSGPLAQQVSLLIEAAAAAIIAVSTRGPFGESERANGRLLPSLRLGTALALAGIAIGVLAAGSAGGRLPGGDLALARNVAGLTGLGLACAAVLGGALAWAGPIAYAGIAEYVLTAAWRTPWIWPARPPHDRGAAICAGLVCAVGLALIALCGSRDTARE